MSCLGGDVIMRGRDDVMSCDDVTMSGWAGRRGKDRSFRLIFSREDLRRVDEDAFSNSAFKSSAAFEVVSGGRKTSDPEAPGFSPNEGRFPDDVLGSDDVMRSGDNM